MCSGHVRLRAIVLTVSLLIIGLFASAMEEVKLIPTSEIAKHNSHEDCWLVIEDQVWDCTKFADHHPGGANREPTTH